MFDAHGAWSWVFLDKIFFDFPQLGKHFFLTIARFQLPVDFLVELPVLGHQLFPGGFIFCFKSFCFRALTLLGLFANILTTHNDFLFDFLNDFRGLTFGNGCFRFCRGLPTAARSHSDRCGDRTGAARTTARIELWRSPADLFGPSCEKLLDLLHHCGFFHAARLTFSPPPWSQTTCV